MANILVTGGAGYVGAHVCKALAAAGHTPVAYDNLSRGYRHLVRWGPLEEGALGDGARLLEVLRRYRPRAVMHLAGFAFVNESIAAPTRYYINNVAGTVSLLGAMRETGVAEIVASSTCAVYAPSAIPLTETAPLAPASPYARSKVMMERMLADCAAAYGLRWMALRYFNAAGADPDGEAGEITTAGVRVIPNLFNAALGARPAFQINGDDYPTPDGTCVRDFTHVCDVADGHIRALDRLGAEPEGGRIFNLGNGRGTSIRALIAAAETVTGLKIPVTVGLRRPGDPSSLMADAGRAAAHLGWQPLYPDLAAMMTHAWAWHRRTADEGRHARG